MKFARKDFVSMKDIDKEEIEYILETSETMKCIIGQNNKKAPYLAGKTVITLFNDSISRNKLSFELAAKYLGANTVDLKTSNSKDYGSLMDIAKVIDQMVCDFVIIRNPMSGSAKFLSENTKACVINAGDGMNENPSQSLLDLLTIKTQKKTFNGLKVCIIGDIFHSRVTRSNIWGLLKLGADVSVASMPTLIPDGLEELGVKVYYDAHKAVSDCDVILCLRMDLSSDETSLLPSLNEYKNLFKIDKKMISYAKDDVIVMHPGPINRGIEISSEIINSKKCLIDDQITNGVAVRMALLYLLSVKEGVNYEIVD